MKKILLSLLLFVGLSFVNLSFGNYKLNVLTDEDREFLMNNSLSSGTIDNQYAYALYDFGTEDSNIYNNLCVIFDGFSRTSNFGWRIAFASTVGVGNAAHLYDINDPSIHCSSGRRRYFLIQSTSTSNKFTINHYYVFDPQILFGLNSNLLSCNSDLSSCQSDLNTCQNDLINCGGSMTGDCQQNTGDIQRSSLYINDIQHLGSENINITIPEEISWNYTGDDQNFDLDIEGYNTDSDYIAGIITTQNSKPSKSDLNYIISSLLPLFVPGLVIILFIYFVFKFIKKVF